MARKPTPPAAAPIKATGFTELGGSGLRQSSGYVHEEFLRELSGLRGIETLRQMSENDSTIGAALAAIGLVLRAVEWRCEPQTGDESAEGAEAAEFGQSLLDDMSHTHEDLIAEILTMLVYGWSYFEVVYKRRVGPNETDPTKRSRFTDGAIGVRKIAPRSQDSLSRWEFDEDGGIKGMWQRPYMAGQEVFLPIERSLLFRTTSRKNSPEGVSVLRSAYVAWYFLTKIQQVEAIGIERDLAGLPVVEIPNAILNGTDPASLAAKARYQQISSDLRFNSQGGLMIPSDTFIDAEGKPTQIKLVSINLLASGGTRAINTAEIKTGYQRDMARSVLADFLMLGTDKGAYNLSESKTNLFLKACETFANGICAVFNRYLLPRVWALNGKDPAHMPVYIPGQLTPFDLAAVADFIQKLSASGATLFPDENLENFLRNAAEIPEKTPEAIREQEEVVEGEHERMLDQIDAKKPAPGEAAPPDKAAL